MPIPADFPSTACARYQRANRDMLHWLLARKNPKSPFIDTKLNSVTLVDFADDDGLKGPPYLYGWIQGRGLEALIFHAGFFRESDPELAKKLDAWTRDLYAALDELWDRNGWAAFCYGPDMRPLCTGNAKAGQPQRRDDGFSTYADTFVAKGLIAAASKFAPHDLPRHLEKLDAIILAIDEGRFVISEALDIDQNAADTQADDFGPRMILLTAASLTRRLALSEHGAFAPRFIDHVIARHYLPDCGLLSIEPGGTSCNIGHTIEFSGFAFEAMGDDLPAELVPPLQNILTSTFAAGFSAPGLCLTIDIKSGQPTSPYCPWWSLPETIRAAALCFKRTGSKNVLDVWATAHEAFFTHYWRDTPPVAYQTLTSDGPADVVPGTPDLDAGYHTGLSFLTAIETLDRDSR